MPATAPGITRWRRIAGKVGATEHAEINRNIRLREFQDALDAAREAGLRRQDERVVVRAMMG